MECPYCNDTNVTLVKDRLVIESRDSKIKKILQPVERPSSMGPVYIIAGITLLVSSVILKNTRVFTNMFWDGHFVSVLDKPGINPIGWTLLVAIWIGCVACALYGAWLLVSKSEKLESWERKNRFYEGGLICSKCMSVWLPGLESHPFSINDFQIK